MEREVLGFMSKTPLGVFNAFLATPKECKLEWVEKGHEYQQINREPVI